MVNRFLIRFKVLQVLYAYYTSLPDITLEQAKKELSESIAKSYELYHLLLRLPVELTNTQERRLADAKKKFLPSSEDLSPNTKFVDNRLVELLRSNDDLCNYVDQCSMRWQDDMIFMKVMLDKVLASDEYKAYMASDEDSLHEDGELWRDLFRKVILPDGALAEQLEERSVYWSIEDLDLMGQFAMKTMKRLEDGTSEDLLPMYHNDEDRDFGEMLLVRAVCQLEQNIELISSFVTTERWDPERIAVIDKLVMSLAVTEFTGFENIPTTVTLNEYIELAKQFSTPNSGQFINGILYSVLNHLRANGKVVKP